MGFNNNMEFNYRNIGSILIIASIIIIVILISVKLDMDKKDVFLCEAVDTNKDLTMDQCPAHTSNASWYLLFAFGITVLILGTGVYLFFITPSRENETKERKEEKNSSLKAIDVSKLDEDEKKVYQIMKEKDGSAYQSDLIKELQCSKVKITRILDKMEQKQILERKRRGMTNLIVLR